MTPDFCDALGDLYRVGATGIDRDRDRARSIYDRACRGGDDFECFKRECLDADHDACYKVWSRQKDRYYRLGGRFDMR